MLDMREETGVGSGMGVEEVEGVEGRAPGQWTGGAIGANRDTGMQDWAVAGQLVR